MEIAVVFAFIASFTKKNTISIFKKIFINYLKSIRKYCIDSIWDWKVKEAGMFCNNVNNKILLKPCVAALPLYNETCDEGDTLQI